jgi:hypothetical protein
MQAITIGLDLAKHWSQVHGCLLVGLADIAGRDRRRLSGCKRNDGFRIQLGSCPST